MSFWRLSGSSSVLVGGTGNVLDCANCPCTVTVPCCNGANLPGTLSYTITAKTGACIACLGDSGTIVANGLGGWTTIDDCNTAEDACVGNISIQCADSMSADCATCLELIGVEVGSATITDCSLDPFTITFDVVSALDGTFTITFTG